jgi:hypothetical protein
MAQDQRAEREFALNEMRANRDMAWQDQTRPVELAGMQQRNESTGLDIDYKRKANPLNLRGLESTVDTQEKIAPNLIGKSYQDLLAAQDANVFNREMRPLQIGAAREGLYGQKFQNRMLPFTSAVKVGYVPQEYAGGEGISEGLSRFAEDRGLDKRKAEAEIYKTESAGRWYDQRQGTDDDIRTRAIMHEAENRLLKAREAYLAAEDQASKTATMFGKGHKMSMVDATLAERAKAELVAAATEWNNLTKGGGLSGSTPVQGGGTTPPGPRVNKAVIDKLMGDLP